MTIQEGIDQLAVRQRMKYGDESPEVQVLCIAEEFGEFIKDYRTARGFSRKHRFSVSVEDLREELADLAITAMVMARLLGGSAAEDIQAKLAKIEDRGGL